MAEIDDRLNRAVKTARKQDKSKRNTQQDTYFNDHPGEHTLKAPKESFRSRIAKAFYGGISAPSVKGISAGEIGPINHTDPVAGYLNVDINGKQKDRLKMGRASATAGHIIAGQAAGDAENVGTAAEGISRGLSYASNRRKPGADALIGPINHLDPVSGYMGVDANGKKKQPLSGMDLKKASKTARKVADKAYAYSDQYHKDLSKMEKIQRKGLGKVGNAAVDVANMLGDVGGDLATSAINPALGTVRMVSRSAGQAGYSARKSGNASYGGRAAYSAAMGGLGLAMSKIGNVSGMLKGAYGRGVLDSIGATGAVDDAVNELVKSATGRAALKAAGAAGTQALYTNLQDRITPVIERATGVNPDAKYDSHSAVKNAAMSAIMGFLTATPEMVRGVGADIQTGREQSADASANRVYHGYDENGIFSPKTEAQKELTQESAEAYGKAGYRFGGENSNRVEWVKPPEWRENAATQAAPAAEATTGVQAEKDAPGTRVSQNGENEPVDESAYSSIRDSIKNGKRVDTSNLDSADFDRVADTGAAIDSAGRAYIPNPNEHIDARTMENVGTRSVNAFQFDHPELHGYFQDAANDLMSDADISNSLPNNAQKSRTLDGNQWNHTAMTSPALREAMDETGLSRADIIDAAQRLVEDHGQENVAAAKRLELVLDDMLTHGYETMDGRTIEPNEAYLKAKQDIPGYTEAEQGGHGLDDVDPDLGAANAGQFGKFGQMQGETGSFHDINEESARRSAEMHGRAPEEVPRVNPYSEENISKTVSTVLNSPSTSNEFAPVLEDAVARGAFDYIPVTDDAVSNQAYKHLQQSGGYRDLANQFIGKAEGNTKITKQDFADAVAAYNEAVKAGDAATALNLSVSMAESARTSAQTVQAMNLFNRMTPSGKLYSLQKAVNKWNDQFFDFGKRGNSKGKYKMPGEDISLVDAAEENTGLSIDKELAGKYLSASSDDERAAAWDAITTDLASKIPSTVKEKWDAWRYMSMLTNPVTHVRNMGGNAIMYLARETKNLIGTGLESAFVKDRGQRTKSVLTLSDSDKALREFAKGQFVADQDASMGQGKYSDVRNDIMREIQEKRKMFGEHNPLQWVSEKNSSLLDKEDVLWNKPSYVESFAEALKAKGVTAEEAAAGEKPELVQSAREYAISEAQKATFRDSNDFSDFVASLGNYKGENKTKRALSVGADALLPFRRTPANILVRGALDYSPASIARALGEVVKGKATAADVVDHLATGLTGTGVLGLGAFLAHQGVLKYNPGGDDDRKEGFLKDSGMQDFSIQIGNKSYTLDWMSPAAMPLFAGAAMMEAHMQNGVSSLKSILDGFGRAGDTILNTSMLSSMNNAMSNISYSQNPAWFMVANTLSSYLSQAVPTIGGKVASAIDPIVRSAYVQPGKDQVSSDVDYFAQSVLKRIPGARSTMQPMIDLWGNEVSNGSAGGRAVQNFLSPGYFSTTRNDPVDKEVMRLADSIGDHTIYPGKAEKTITVNHKRVNLTAEQYTQYAKTIGTARHDVLSALVKNRSYRELSDEDKAELVRNAYEYAAEKGKSAVSEYQMEGWKKKAEESGVGVPTYLLYKHLLSVETDKAQANGLHRKDANAAVRKKILADDSLSAEQKNKLDDLLISDLTIIPEDKKVDYSSPESFKVSQMSDGAQRHYAAVKNAYGLSADAFSKAWSIYHDNSLHAAQKRSAIANATGKNGYALYKEFGKRVSGGAASSPVEQQKPMDALTKILLGMK